MRLNIGWLIAVIFVLVGVLFLSGHGWQLIAGYNTATKEKKTKYDLNRLYLVNGVGFLVIGMLVAVMNSFVDDWSLVLQILFLAVFIVLVMVLVILNGTWCMKNEKSN